MSLRLARAETDYASLAIARFEALYMLANASDAEEARRLCGPSTSVVELPMDDSWTRDSGPVFLLDEGGSAFLRFTVTMCQRSKLEIRQRHRPVVLPMGEA